MIIHTASEGISFAKTLENNSASFYESISQKFSEESDILLTFTRENKKNIAQTERVYFGVITDAIEGSYAFNIETDKYAIETDLNEKDTYAAILKQAIQVEEQIMKYYSDAAEQSRSLMADIPRAFDLLVKKRRSRIEVLKTLIDKTKAL
ncbi:MAG TPA: hypothetical protein VGA85_07745 [Dehalococcoidales bacterium]